MLQFWWQIVPYSRSGNRKVSVAKTVLCPRVGQLVFSLILLYMVYSMMSLCMLFVICHVVKTCIVLFFSFVYLVYSTKMLFISFMMLPFSKAHKSYSRGGENMYCMIVTNVDLVAVFIHLSELDGSYTELCYAARTDILMNSDHKRQF